MKYFLQALKEGGRLWPYLVGAFACSLLVAALWGANIAALFPLIETTLSGKSAQQWNLEALAEAERALAENSEQLAAVEVQLQQAPAAERPALRLQADKLGVEVEVNRASVASAEWVRDNVAAWLPNKPFETIAWVVALVFLGTLLRVALVLANAILVGWVSESIVRDIRSRVFNKALELDPASFQAYGISGVQAHITHTADMLAHGITSVFSGAVNEPLRIVSCLVGAMMISWRLTLASLLLAPLAACLIYWLNRQVRGLSTKMLDRSLGFYHIALDVLGSHQAVQSNTMEPFERDRFHASTGEMQKIALVARFYAALASPLTELLGIGMLCTGLLTSSYLVLNQETSIFGIPMTSAPLSVPAVTVFLGFLIGAADPLRKLSRVIAGINSGMAAANIIYPLLERDHWIRDPEGEPRQVGRIKTIEFRDAVFSYDGSTEVLRGVNLTIHDRDRIAIVGVNGSGKSTLVNLICRFYDVTGGDVLINGCTTRLFALADLRSRFAVVGQKAELFNESVMHNIRYGRWDATDEEVVAAARMARAHEFISEMPEGYQTVIGTDGRRLSGGQRQRLALARAFLRDAEVLILDEATSQIDVDSERQIHEALAEYGHDRTIVFITHRESTLSLATRVVRMESGRAVEVDMGTLHAA
ncbi:Lipid A export ATP-binding/permease protein MsbA [Posidoniimonas corsicana]|uniref:Lipid A export ATP-binding/permease protein MsbA n=1 Tax=Posidoniimonas corsicana TaxID=1938618 RepID=A0A5C5VHE9_9BACT|nr:ABC transporter ATP-binding protein [Posidoniimonas corsicana]TWT37102.1 Lipid A export ATP-binding/permease protein MsbA [Posidoniimonas corsicana]